MLNEANAGKDMISTEEIAPDNNGAMLVPRASVCGEEQSKQYIPK